MQARLGTVVNAPVRITQFFGANPDKYMQYGFNGHEGIDLVAPVGTIITSATNGKVTFAGNKGDNYGNFVQVFDGEQNILTLYAHLQDVVVKKDQEVKEGDIVGHLGGTGNVTGPHLHFGVMRTKPPVSQNEFGAVVTVITVKPLNPLNGYKGWEDPRNDSLFDLYRGGFGFDQGPGFPPLSQPETPVTPSGTTKGAFDAIFAQFYAGWGRPEAEADFNKTYGGDLAKLKVARGYEEPGKKKTLKVRPSALKKIYQLNPQFDQMSLNKIAGGGILGGRVDVLASFLGINADDLLRGGQELSLNGFPTDYYPDSSEWQDFLRLTSKGKIGKPGDYYIKPEYAGLNLKDISGRGVAVGRTDVLATFLGISENMPIPGDQGFGTQAFPNSYIPNSSEWIGFQKIFTTTPPVPVEESTPEVLGDSASVPLAGGIPREATIRVTSTPSKAKFYIDGLYFNDRTPANKAYPVAAGQHEVRIELPGYEDYITVVDVAPSEQKTVSWTFVKGESGLTERLPASALGTSIALEALVERVAKIEAILTSLGRL